MKNDPDRSGVQKRTPGQFCCTEQVWAAQDESGVSVAMCITEDDTPLSIPDEETPPSGNAGTGFWSILFQLLEASGREALKNLKNLLKIHRNLI